MKRFSLTLCLLLVCASAWALDDAGQLAYNTLQRASCFALGPLGYGGQTGNEEFALRVLMRQKDADAAFKSLYLTAFRPAGKFYALLGLRWRGAPAYKPLLAERIADKHVILMMNGCVGKEKRSDAVAREIARGLFDEYKPRRQTDKKDTR